MHRALLLAPLGALALAAPCGAAPGVFSQDGEDPPDELDRWRALRTTELVLQVVRARNQVDPGIFAVLAERGDREALEALEQCAPLVVAPAASEPLFRAIAGLGRVAGLETDVRVWLLGQVMGELPYTVHPATRALATLGSDARAELWQVLRAHPDPVCRQIAVGGLITELRATGDEEALEVLLTHYRYPNSGPRELGVRTLAAFRGPAALDRFARALQRDDVSVQTGTLIVEALGRMHGMHGMQGGDGGAVDELLVRTLRSRRPALQLAAIEALARHGGTGHWRELERLERSKNPAVRRAAFVAQAAFRIEDETWTARVFEASATRDEALRLGAVEALAALRNPLALDRLHLLLEDPSHRVRRSAALALGHKRRKTSIPLLIECLAEDSLRVRSAAREALGEITGEDFGPRALRWRAWWTAEGEGFVVPPLAAVRETNARRAERRRENPTQAEFYGIRIDSDRVCFVIDTSGSMSNPMYTGGSRLEAVTRELVKALESFPVGGRFNLIFFSKRPHSWKTRLVEKDERSLARATHFARQQRANGATALYDALIDAFEDEDVDTIVLLSDGEPTDGELIDATDIIEDISLRNEVRQIVIHCVSVNHVSTVLGGLAEATGGTYREVR